MKSFLREWPGIRRALYLYAVFIGLGWGLLTWMGVK